MNILTVVLSLFLAVAEPTGKVDPIILATSRFSPSSLENLDFVTDGRVKTLVRVDPNASPSAPPEIDFRMITRSVAYAEVPIEHVSKLNQIRGLVWAQPVRRLELCQDWLNAGVKGIGADQVWTSRPSYTGAGVIVGVIDTGIDFRHPDFRNPDGSSKILSIWDQSVTIPGRSPAGFRYGTEWSVDEIESGIARDMDYDGHGTHVAGTVLSVAPDAWIVAVKSYLFDYQVIDAIAYIRRVAEEHEMPAVVNMSFGGHDGPHDGRSILDTAIDELIGGLPGMAAVAAAGNDGDDYVHVGGRVPSGFSGQFPSIGFRAGIDRSYAIVQLWSDSREKINAALEVTDANGADHRTRFVAPGESVQEFITDGQLAGLLISLASYSPHPMYPDLNMITVEAWNMGRMDIPIDAADFRLFLDGAGVSIDAYALGTTRFTEGNDGLALRPDSERSIGSPSSAHNVICVASYAVSNEWPTVLGTMMTSSYANIGQISVFSSRGPLRNGSRKPDVAAPGQMIASALSGISSYPPSLILPDGQHVVFQGTSMASPHVAGSVALLLQKNPGLPPEQTISIVNSSTRDEGQSGWDRLWGYGIVDVPRMLGVPTTPRLLEVLGGDQTITARWSAVADAVGYLIIDNGARIDVGNRTDFTIVNVPNGERHTLTVVAYNSRGAESQPSNEMIAVTNEAGIDISPPARITDLWTVPGDGEILVEWSPSQEPDIDFYVVHWGMQPGDYPHRAVTDHQTEYRITGLTNEITVYLYVTAVDEQGNESEPSPEIRAVPSRYNYASIKQMPGSPFELDGDSVGSPVMADITGDGVDDLIVSGCQGVIQARSYVDGVRVLWNLDLNGKIRSEPAIGDLNNDGLPDLTFTTERHIYYVSSFGRIIRSREFDSEVISSPVLADLDQDGTAESIIVLSDGSVFVIDSSGQEKTAWHLVGRTYESASIAISDLNDDGFPDICIKTDSDLSAYTKEGKSIWQRIESDVTYDRAAPVIADFTGDSNPDVVVGRDAGRLMLLGQRGETIWEYETGSEFVGISAGDLDRDGIPELTAMNEMSELHVLRGDGSLVDGFPVQLHDESHSTPLLVDLDADSKPEILIAVNSFALDGFIYGVESDGKIIPEFRLSSYAHVCTPAVGDLDDDGDLEIAISTLGGFADKSEVDVWDMGIASDNETSGWTRPRYDLGRTGSYPLPVKSGIDGDHVILTQWGEIKSALLQNYPNPFNPETWIPFVISRDSRVTIEIFDQTGRKVWEFTVERPAGRYVSKEKAIRWDGRNLHGERVASGTYLCVMTINTAPNERFERKMVIIK